MNKEASDSEINREIKQNYLQDNILDKGFDTSEFLLYLTEIKKTENATNIDFWSLEDLKKVKYKNTSNTIKLK